MLEAERWAWVSTDFLGNDTSNPRSSTETAPRGVCFSTNSIRILLHLTHPHIYRYTLLLFLVAYKSSRYYIACSDQIYDRTRTNERTKIRKVSRFDSWTKSKKVEQKLIQVRSGSVRLKNPAQGSEKKRRRGEVRRGAPVFAVGTCGRLWGPVGPIQFIYGAGARCVGPQLRMRRALFLPWWGWNMHGHVFGACWLRKSIRTTRIRPWHHRGELQQFHESLRPPFNHFCHGNFPFLDRSKQRPKHPGT